MTVKEYQDRFISPSIVNLGFINNKTKHKFVIRNTGDIPIASFKLDCGCIGNCQKYPDRIECELTSDYSGQMEDMFLVDGMYCTKMRKGEEDVYHSIEKRVTIDNPTSISGVIKVAKFDKGILIKLADGAPDEIVEATGAAKDNQDKLKFRVQVKAYILP